MRDRNKAIMITAFSIVLLVAIAFASGVKTTPPTTPKVTPQSQVIPGTPIIPQPMTQKSAQVKITKPVLTEAQKRAQKINSQCLKMKGVIDSATIVAGNSALIACKFSKNVKNVNAEKKMIADKIKALDKSIKTCTVTESLGIMSKIRALFNSSNQSYINSETKKIIKEATPITR